MAKISEDLNAPAQHRNGLAHAPIEEEPKGDRTTIYLVFGGILLAFAIGLGFMIYALMLDWQ